MKVGGTVNYIGEGYELRKADITGVVGTGASGYKTLDLVLADGTVYNDVPHEKDANSGPHWREVGTRAAKEPEPEKPKANPRRRPKKA